MKTGLGELEAFLEVHPDTSYVDALVIDLYGNAIGMRLPSGQANSPFAIGTPSMPR
jgi:hypothetical protein